MPIVLLCYLLYQSDYQKMTLVKLSWQYLPVVIVSIFGSYSMRSIFYQQTISDIRLNFKVFFCLTGFYNFISSIVPFALGHFSYPHMLKRYYGVVIHHGLTSLLMYNSIRIGILLTFFIYSIIALDLNKLIGWSYSKSLIMIVVAMITFLIFLKKSYVIRRFTLIKKTERLINNIISDFRRNIKCGKLSLLILYSVVVVMFNALNTYLSYRLFGYTLSVVGTILVISVVNLSNLLPIHGIGRFGSHEGLNTLVLMSLGFSSNEAIQLSFAVHISQLLIQCAIAVPCYYFMMRYAE